MTDRVLPSPEKLRPLLTDIYRYGETHEEVDYEALEEDARGVLLAYQVVFSRLAAETKRREAAEAVAQILKEEFAGFDLPMGLGRIEAALVAWERAKAEHKKVVNQ